MPVTPPASRPATATAIASGIESAADVLVLEIGTRVAADTGYYADIDMIAPAGSKPALYTRRDSTPYTDIRRRGPAG